MAFDELQKTLQNKLLEVNACALHILIKKNSKQFQFFLLPDKLGVEQHFLQSKASPYT